jgi:membrane protease YdiL (CAAX protease family)
MEPPRAMPSFAPPGTGAAAPLGIFLFSSGAFLLACGPAARALGTVAGTAACQLACFAVIPAAALGVFRVNPSFLHLAWPRRGTRLESVLLPVLAVFLFVQYQNIQETFLYRNQEALEEVYRKAFQIETLSPSAILLGVAVVPAFCEELLFRGILLGGLRARLGTPGAVLVSSALFAAVHFDPLVLLPIFLLGILLGTITVVTGSLIPAVVVHLLNNALVTSFLLAPPFAESLGEALPMGPIPFLLALVVVASLLWTGSRRARTVPVSPTQETVELR